METQQKATHEEDKRKLRWLQQYLRGKELGSITRDAIAEIGSIKAKESSAATANRYLTLIRAILRKASLEWEWINWVPKVTLYREAKRRVRWITPEQARRCCRNCRYIFRRWQSLHWQPAYASPTSSS